MHEFKIIDGAIPYEEIVRILKEASDQKTGGLSIFNGQVRADMKDNNTVLAIEYSFFEEAIHKVAQELMNKISASFNINRIWIFHSRGLVKAGELCLSVMVTSGHRKDAITACTLLVEEIKQKLPVWGKEILDNTAHTWKINI